MNDIIKVLPDSVANQIAAGEVIQRPASVIKELVENAVDAGATRIELVLKDAGRTLIQVIDNGSGMSDTDARMAFERHATSKIACADDLFALHTMGFRGEALASIAAIAQLEVKTMRKEAQIGTRLLINGSRVESQQPEVCARGTNISVRNLFFNVPARRRFLKKDSTEYTNDLREFERLALVNPSIEFKLTHNDRTAFAMRGGSFLERISSLFGAEMSRKLIPVETETPIVGISGFISLPEFARRRGALQYLLVNGRNMRHPYFHKAILNCYSSLLPPDAQPNYFLNFTVDPSKIDVNIHPTKNEIKFEDEQAVWQILTAAVNESLGRFNAAPAIDFNRDNAPDIPVFSPDPSIATPPDVTDPGFNPFGQTGTPRPSRPPRGWDSLYKGFLAEGRQHEPCSSGHVVESSINQITSGPPDAQGELDLDLGITPSATLQLRNRYILTPSAEGLMVIDQHQAHKLILFHQYLEGSGLGKATATQRLLFPIELELSTSLDEIMSTISPQLIDMGFETERTSDRIWSVTGVPPSVNESIARHTILGLLDSVENHGTTEISDDEWRRKVALTVAEAAAIKAGQPLTPEQMDRLAGNLFALPSPLYTPDGHKVFVVVNFEQISKWLD